MIQRTHATPDGTFRCTDCGRFISFADIESGAASHRMTSPDSAYTSEEWETICAKCKKEESNP